MSIIPFAFPDTGQPVRVVTVGGEPRFVVADVCRVLGIGNPSDAARRLHPDDLDTIEVTDSLGRTQQAHATTESGLYDLILDSRKSQARAFRRWITSEVVPSIRRTGGYWAPRPEPTKLELARDLVAALEDAEAARARVAELEPDARSWRVLASGEGDYSVSDAAKILSRDGGIRIGRGRLFAVLAEQRWTYRQAADDKPRARQYAVERGWLSELPQSYQHPRTGELTLAAPQVRVTPKGLSELHKRLGGVGALVVAGGAR
jgi:prophage antirepressor-like protein